MKICDNKYTIHLNILVIFTSILIFTTQDILAQNNAVLFNGPGDRIRIRDVDPADPGIANPDAYKITGTEITLEAWVYPMAIPGGEKYVIAGRPVSPLVDPYQSYALYIQNGFPSFAISTGLPGSEIEIVSSVNLPLFQWSHIAGLYDGKGIAIFVNGSFTDSIGTSIALTDSGVGFYIGRYLGNSFLGLIDDVRLWNYARSFADIDLYKNVVLVGDESGLAGYWRLDEESIVNNRRVALDATSNQNHLLIEGITNFVGFNPLIIYGPPSIVVSGGPIDFGVIEQFTESGQGLIGITNSTGGPLVGYFTDDEDLLNVSGTFFYEPGTGSSDPVSITANVAGSISGDIEIYSNDASSPSNIAFQAEVLSNHAFDANNISMYTRRDGENARGPDQNAGFEWPKGTSKFAIYSTGLWIGAQVAGDTRLAVIQYNSEFYPGPIIGGVAADPNNTEYRMYKISNISGPGDPDYDEWPKQLGAPVNLDGTPKLIGDQTLFTVFNDAEPSNHYIFATQPLGAEIQEIIYGSAGSGAVNDAVFLRYKIINKSSSTWENAYISLWADADLGDYRDDVVGVDTARNMGYMYNGDDYDDEFLPNLGYGATPPALGMKLIEGVRADDPLEAFAYYVTGGTYPVNDPQNAEEAYNFMQGLRADGTPFFDPVANQNTKFPFSGDPVTSSGWYDDQPQDHRLMISAGPFNLSPDESTDFTAVLLMAQGANRLGSVTALRAAADELDGLYGPFIVNSTDDNPDINPGDGVAEDINGNTTLRAAIMEANVRPGNDSIWFNISGAGDPVVILPQNSLPTINDPVIIDGYTQPGAVPATMTTPAVLKIVIDGTDNQGFGGGNGLKIRSDNCVIRGLVINNFLNNGIELDTSANYNKISGNYIGINSDGDAKALNSGSGIFILFSAHNLIGGNTPEDRNIISGNGQDGIFIDGPLAINNTISGNYIGLNALGTDSVSNSYSGISMTFNASGNTIGGGSPGARNIISGNHFSGVTINSASASNNKVSGNFIGTDVTGNYQIGNTFGVYLSGSTNNMIGGTVSSKRNIISGNESHGVRLANNASENFISGNYIGTNVSGESALGNGYLHPDGLGTGVFLYGAHNNRVENNIISANESRGITIIRQESYGNIIKKNKIGTDVSGRNPLPNTVNGIEIDRPINQPEQGPGFLSTITENIIAFNGLNGIAVDAGRFHRVYANSIFSNSALGIDLGGDGVTANDIADVDTGANHLQNYPVLTSVQFNAGQVIIDGSLNSKPYSTFELQFYSNQTSDPSGYGEGQHYLGSDTVTVDDNGDVDFTATFPIAIFDGQAITALATSLDSLSTSEFSAAIGATQRQVISPSDFPLHYTINSSGDPTITDGSDISAIQNAFNTWSQINTSVVDFVFDSTTSSRYASATDGLNLVTFADDQFPFPQGVLAIAAKTLDVSAGEENARIIDADIVFNYKWVHNANLQFGTDTRPGNFDIQSIATHEGGHIFGLQHTGVVKATMFMVLQPGQQARSPETDDIAWASFLYPDLGYNTNFGEIAGRVEDGYNPGFPVAGALILATHSTTGDSVHSYSDANGNFVVPGLAAGDYIVSMQSLDGSVQGFPMTPANVSPYIYANTTITDYPHEFYNDDITGEGNQEDPGLFTTVAVSTGSQTTDINLITNIDLTPPEVSEIFPDDGAGGIDIQTEIVTTFSEPIDPATFETAFSLRLAINSIDGSFLYLNENRVAVFTPDQPLLFTTTYDIDISTDLTDARGNPLESAISASFTTGDPDATAPQFLQIDPSNGQDSVFITTDLTLIFSEPININSLTIAEGTTSGSFTLETEGAPVPGSFTFQQQQAVAVFTPTLSLVEGKTYTVTLSADVTDLSGNALSNPTTLSFSTVQQAPPVIVDYGPRDGADQLSLTTPAWARFSEPIDVASVNTNSFQLTQSGMPVTGIFEFTENQSVVVFRPATALLYSTPYRFYVSTDITDLSGDGLQQELDVQFTTASVPTGPEIWSINAPAALTGNEVVIAGQGFDPVKTNNIVTFNGLPATVTQASFYSVTAVVPAGATSGDVIVEVDNVSSAGKHFDVLTIIADQPDNVRSSVDTESDSRDADITPDGTYAYVTNGGASSVSVINLETAQVETNIQVGSGPLKISINPAGTRAYVTNFYDNNVSVIDIDPNSPNYNTQLRTITVGINPYGIAVTPDGSRVYVANFTSQDIMMIDTDPNSGAFNYVRSSIDTEAENRDVDISPDGTLAFVTGSSGLIILDIDADGPANLFNTVRASVDTDSETREVAITPDGTLAVVTTIDGNLLFIDVFPASPTFGEVRSSVDTESDSRDVEISPDGTLLYVSNFNSNTVSVYEFSYISGAAYMGLIASRESESYDNVVASEIQINLIQTIAVGNAPEGIVIDATGNRSVVANSGDGGTATIIDLTGSPDPLETLSMLIAEIDALVADGTLRLIDGLSLRYQLNAAIRRIERGQITFAVLSLRVFINKVTRLIRRDRIPSDIGQSLIDEVEAIINELTTGEQQGLYKLKSEDIYLPDEFDLQQSYPNPFNPQTTIRYDIPGSITEGVHVNISVYNILGQQVVTLVDDHKLPGQYSVIWNAETANGAKLASGIYIYKIEAGDYQKIRKMVLMK